MTRMSMWLLSAERTRRSGTIIGWSGPQHPGDSLGVATRVDPYAATAAEVELDQTTLLRRATRPISLYDD